MIDKEYKKELEESLFIIQTEMERIKDIEKK